MENINPILAPSSEFQLEPGLNSERIDAQKQIRNIPEPEGLKSYTTVLVDGSMYTGTKVITCGFRAKYITMKTSVRIGAGANYFGMADSFHTVGGATQSVNFYNDPPMFYSGNSGNFMFLVYRSPYNMTVTCYTPTVNDTGFEFLCVNPDNLNLSCIINVIG